MDQLILVGKTDSSQAQVLPHVSSCLPGAVSSIVDIQNEDLHLQGTKFLLTRIKDQLLKLSTGRA